MSFWHTFVFYFIDFSWLYVFPVFSFSSVKVQFNFSHEGIFEEIILLLRFEVTKRVYFIGNERMLIAHDSNRLRFG